METTLSSKGQIVIPLQIRNLHGWRPGISFTIIDKDNSLILQPVQTRTKTRLEDVVGCAGYQGERKSQAQMDVGILEEARKRAAAWSR